MKQLRRRTTINESNNSNSSSAMMRSNSSTSNSSSHKSKNSTSSRHPPSYQSMNAKSGDEQEVDETTYNEILNDNDADAVNMNITMNNNNNNSTNTNSNNNASSNDDASSQRSNPVKRNYNWRLYVPSTPNAWHYLRWVMVGGAVFAAPQSDRALEHSLAGLARCLILLRRYLVNIGMPAKGGVRDQEYVLREVVRDLYAGGAPLWALEPVMQKAAEGLTGQPNVNWQLFPRKAFIYSPSAGTTSMFKMERGFNVRKMDAMEKVAVRLTTFASNVEAVSNVPARFPNPNEFMRAARTESVRNLSVEMEDPRKLAKQILRLASKEQGLFYYVNSREYGGNNQHTAGDDDGYDSGNGNSSSAANGNSNNNTATTTTTRQRPTLHDPQLSLNDFWVVKEEERELFSRLACLEAMRTIDEIDKAESDPANKQNPWLIVFYRVCASSGACAFWFQGSWIDMLVAGILAVLVASIGTSSILSKQERLVYEVIASFIVGLVANLIALAWPDHTCFASMAIAGVLDLLQGFRVIFAIIEIMSKHTVAGTADLLEGILFTGLIAYFLRFGQYAAAHMMGYDDNAEFASCSNGIDEFWYFLFVPLAAISWSGLFNPSNRDLLPMALHGILAYGVNYAMSKLGIASELNNFVSAAVVSFSAGILSRFTGRQAVGNTVAGLYVLLPGAYMVTSLFATTIDGSFFSDIIQQAIIIGIGGWTGTILCSPTLLGTTRGLMSQQQQGFHGSIRRGDEKDGRHYRDESTKAGGRKQPTTMLHF